MSGPWEEYGGAATEEGPWSEYGGGATPVAPQPKTALGSPLPPTEPGANTVPEGPTESNWGQKIEGAVQAALAVTSMLTNYAQGLASGTLVAGATRVGEGAGAVATALDRRSRGVPAVLPGDPTMTPAEGIIAGEASRAGYQPPSKVGQEITETIMKPVGEIGIPFLGLGPQLHGMAAGTPQGAVGVAVAPAVKAAGTAARATGRAAGAVAEGVGEVAGKGAAKLSPGISPETAATVRKAAALGIDLPPDAFSKAKATRVAGEALRSVPASGAANDANAIALNRAVARQIGAEGSDRITPKVFDEAITRSGEEIGRITEANPVPLAAVQSTIDGLRDAARKRAPDVARAVDNYLQDLEAKAEENGGIVPGKAMKEILGQMGRDAYSATDGNVRNALGELHSSLTRDVARIVGPEDAAALQQARRYYSNALTIVPLVNAGGDISPAALNQAFRAGRQGKMKQARGRGGEMGDIAEVAGYMREPGSSLTAERALAYSALGGGAWISPTAATTSFLGANLYNRLGPRVLREKAGVKKGPAGGRNPPPPPPPEGPPEFNPRTMPGAGGPRGGEPPPSGPLGDLTPDWETAPGAGPPPAGGAPLPAEGLYRAVGEHPPTTGSRGVPGTRLEIPAVPGRPDLPDTLVSGAPAESAATERANRAMGEPGAIEARRQQRKPPSGGPEGGPGTGGGGPPPKTPPAGPSGGSMAETERLLAQNPPDVVKAVLQEHLKALKTEQAKAEATAKRAAEVETLEQTAKGIADPDLKARLLKQADKLREPIPVPEVIEGQPEIAATVPKSIPAGKVIEGQPEIKAEPVKGKLPVGEAAEITPETIEADRAWRTDSQLGEEDAAREQRVKQALGHDAPAVERAAVKHENDPKAFDAEIERINAEARVAAESLREQEIEAEHPKPAAVERREPPPAAVERREPPPAAVERREPPNKITSPEVGTNRDKMAYHLKASQIAGRKEGPEAKEASRQHHALAMKFQEAALAEEKARKTKEKRAATIAGKKTLLGEPRNETKPAAEGSPSVPEPKPPAAAQAAVERPRADSDAAPVEGGERAPAGGQASVREVAKPRKGALSQNEAAGLAASKIPFGGTTMRRDHMEKQKAGIRKFLMEKGHSQSAANSIIDGAQARQASANRGGGSMMFLQNNYLNAELKARGLVEEPPGEMFSSGNPDVFYSPLTRAIEGLKQGKGTPGDWENILRGLTTKGVKAEEIEWSGVGDWLKAQGRQVTREQVLQFLKDGGVKVEEVTKGALKMSSEMAREFEHADPPRNAREWLRKAEDYEEAARGWQAQGNKANAERNFKLAEEMNEMAERLETDSGREHGAPKFSQYQLPGGTKYREVLLTLPGSEPKPMTYQEWVAGGMRGEWSTKGTVQAKTQFKSPHWEEPNVLAHIRLNDRTDADGKRVLFVEEIQSDWAQAGRKRGFKQPAVRFNVPSQWSAPKKITGDYQQGGQWTIYEYTHRPTGHTIQVDPLMDSIGPKASHLRDYPNLLEELALEDYEAREQGGQLTAGQSNRMAELQARLNRGEDLPPAEQAEFDDLIGIRISGTDAASILLAPFVGKTEAWTALAIKRIVKLAADEGYDRVAFINGEQSAERYDLSKQLSRVDYEPSTNTLDAYGPDGLHVLSKTATPEELPDLIGKEATQRLLDRPVEDGRKGTKQSLRGLDLKVGGEGMKAFYDKIVPNVAKDVLRKLGGEGLKPVDFGGKPLPILEIINDRTGAVEAEYKGDQRAAAEKWIRFNVEGQKNLANHTGDHSIVQAYSIREGASIPAGVREAGAQPGFDITPKMRESAAGGVPLFKQAGSPGAKPVGSPEALDTLLREKFGSKLIEGLHEQGILKYALARDEGQTGDRSGVKAVFRQRPGEKPAATLYFDRITPETAPKILMHELGEHFGIQRMLGTERYDVMLNDLRGLRNTPEVREAWKHVERNYIGEGTASKLKGTDDPTFLREVAARLVEEHPDLPFVRRLINEIRAFLYEHFGTTLGNRVDANLIRGMAAAALRKAAKGDLPATPPVKTFRPLARSLTKPQVERRLAH